MELEIGVREKVMEAIEEYNRTMTNPLKENIYSKLKVEELKGILYNSFRRKFPDIFNASRSRCLSIRIFIHDIECTFNANRTLATMSITKTARRDSYSTTNLTDYLKYVEIKSILNSINSDTYLKKMIEEIGHPPEESTFEVTYV